MIQLYSSTYTDWCNSIIIVVTVATLHSRCGHYIIPLWFLSFFLLFFLAYSQQSEIGCLPYFRKWCGLSANLECMSEICCTVLAGNTRHKKLPSAHHCTTLSGYIFTTKACIGNPIKNLLTRMLANAQRDGRPAEYRWRPLFNAAKFRWLPVLECHAVTLPRRETHWN